MIKAHEIQGCNSRPWKTKQLSTRFGPGHGLCCQGKRSTAGRRRNAVGPERAKKSINAGVAWLGGRPEACVNLFATPPNTVRARVVGLPANGNQAVRSAWH